MSETTYLKDLVVVEDGIAYKFKGVSLSESNASTILDNLISEYTTKYNDLNTQVTALENQIELGQVKFVTDMTELNTNPIVNTLYVNDEVVGIVDDGSGIIPEVYLKDGTSVKLQEVDRKEEDPDDGNEYLGYVNKLEYLLLNVTIAEGDLKRVANPITEGLCYGCSKVLTDAEDNANTEFTATFGNVTGLGAECVNWLIQSANSGFSPELSLTKDIFNGVNLTITRLDTNATFIGMSTSTYLLYDFNAEPSTNPIFTANDVGKTIQIKIEKVS